VRKLVAGFKNLQFVTSVLDERRRTVAQSSDVTPQELKQSLVAGGLEVYRTTGAEVRLAERPRENLILDSGVKVASEGSQFVVTVVFRAEKTAHPDLRDTGIFSRVAMSALLAEDHGFVETDRALKRIEDPSNPGRVLDTFYEITMVMGCNDIASALDLVRFALALERSVLPSSGQPSPTQL
jgi:hypothetical protein